MSKSLKRGRMISLSHVKDKFWVDFRYERLPKYCMECGIIGHPYNKCSVFLEKLDNGEEPALEYQPFIKGSALPTSSYDRYRTDFAKGDVWPLLTRLAKKSLSSAIPQLHLRGPPQPRRLFAGESSHINDIENPSTNVPHNTMPSHLISQSLISQPSSVIFQSSATNASAMSHSHHVGNTKSKGPAASLPPDSPTNYTDLTSIYMPISSSPLVSNTYATYPPPPPAITSLSNQTLAIPGTNHFNSIIAPATVTTGKENLNPNVQFKRQSEGLSLRQTLKRCRGNIPNDHNSTLSVEENDCHFVSNDFMDSVGDYDNAAETVLHNGLEVPRVGLGGGLMLLWKDDVDVTLNSFNANVFYCYLAFHNGPSSHFTAFYGAPNVAHPVHTWTLLKRLKDVAPSLPWVVIGDFNEILYNHNKKGGNRRCESQMEDFRTILDMCNLNELPFTGDPFTWIKGRHKFASDHRAIAVDVLLLNSTHAKPARKTRFRFEKMWLKEEEAAVIIRSNWKFGKMKKVISQLQQSVAALNNATDKTNATVSQLKNTEAILDELLAQEEEYWHQRSRVDWLQCGDQNTKFFHAHASSRQAKNTIKSLINDQGITVNSKDDLTQVICSFYSSLFATDGVQPESLQTVLNAIPETIPPTMNMSLTAPFTPEEVVAALKSMSPDKSPGSDGMSAMFYQNYWDIVGISVTQIILGVFNDGNDMTQLNKSIITLIPKVSNPTSMSAYRPISLCNVIYKLISKVIVLRFQKVLPYVISETQSAFLSNRLITDNILVAFELIHCLRHKNQGRLRFSALKLDMSKAFDRVEWKYLEAVMLRMGFASKWVTLIKNCICTSSFSFSLNGEIVGHVQPSRGLRQGDPLSLYLFLICSEGLSRLLQYEEAVGNLEDFIRAKLSTAPTAITEQSQTHAATNITMQKGVPWSPPAINGFKLNVDAGTNLEQKKLGVGAIIRDHEGNVVATLSKIVQGSFRSDEMEAKSLFHALNWASQFQYLVTHIEIDASRVSTALLSNATDLSRFSNLIFDVRCLISSFPGVLISHVKRSANQAAHGLAKFALGLDEDMCWVGEIPYPIFSVVVNDFSL
uniref:Reverse transcriptase domain-containing protein n=1 Tax=Cannabis sativa TaxID=3483 RepID=A0A803P559_CANSA